jgi:hypothetical protein
LHILERPVLHLSLMIAIGWFLLSLVSVASWVLLTKAARKMRADRDNELASVVSALRIYRMGG